MKLIKKILIGLFLGALVVFSLTGCGSDKKKAMEIIEKYMNALSVNDMTTMYECYDPDLQAASEGLTNSIAGYFGIEAGYSTGLALGGLLQNAFQDVTGISVDYELEKVHEAEFEKNEGHVDAKYKAVVKFEKYDASVDVEVLYKFDMIKKDDNWYIKNVVEEQIESDEGLQEKVTQFVEEINKQKSDVVQKEGLVEPTRAARDFSDGLAWVSGEAIGKPWVCINTKGKIVFSLEGEFQPYSNFVNGSALVYETEYKNTRTYEKFSLINNKGKIVADLSEYEVICPESYNGRIMVMKKGETFEGTWTELGVMGANGQWEMPLTKEHIFIQEDETLWSGDFEYIGNNVIECNDKCFNIKTGKTFDYVGDFVNGYTIKYSDYNVSVLVYDTEGNEKEIIPENFENEEERYELGNYGEGMFWVGGANKFYDENGAMKIDLSEYKLSEAPFFQDGYALLKFSNDYFTIMDKTGKFMFDPIKAQSVDELYQGILGYKDTNGTWQYINVKGKQLFEWTHGGLIFFDGYACVRVEGGESFINTKGERLY